MFFKQHNIQSLKTSPVHLSSYPSLTIFGDHALLNHPIYILRHDDILFLLLLTPFNAKILTFMLVLDTLDPCYHIMKHCFLTTFCCPMIKRLDWYCIDSRMVVCMADSQENYKT